MLHVADASGELRARGDAIISLVADIQDPPEVIRDFVRKWEEGYRVVAGIKKESEESALMFAIRRLCYRTLRRLSDVELIEQFTGFGLYDRQVIDILRSIGDPYRYFRGLIADTGFDMAKVDYVQPTRKRGVTKHSFYTLYDAAMAGLTSYTKVPLRLATMLGFASAALGLLVALSYLVYKLMFWNRFQLGLALLVVGIFFLSVQLFFPGIVGEYVGSIRTHVRHTPLVVEKERINFD